MFFGLSNIFFGAIGFGLFYELGSCFSLNSPWPKASFAKCFSSFYGRCQTLAKLSF
jgi:hypothetical protein